MRIAFAYEPRVRVTKENINELIEDEKRVFHFIEIENRTNQKEPSTQYGPRWGALGSTASSSRHFLFPLE